VPIEATGTAAPPPPPWRPVIEMDPCTMAADATDRKSETVRAEIIVFMVEVRRGEGGIGR